MFRTTRPSSLFTRTFAVLISVCAGGTAWASDAPLALSGQTASGTPMSAQEPLQPLSPTEIAAASKTIDALLDADLAKHNIKPNPRITDELFARRAYIELDGRIPTLDELNAFLATSKSQKRQELIHDLIGSDGWVSNRFNYWADLLRVETRLNDRFPGQPYIDWLKQSLHDNKPYDQLVRDMLTSSGPASERGNGATGYYIRDAGMPLDNMANTVQVFLGTQLTCAQCHNHPNDKWTRKDFFEMAAFTAGTNVNRNFMGGGNKEMKQEYRDVAKSTPEVKQAFRQLTETIGLHVQAPSKSSIALPADYQYPDAKPGAQVLAHTMFGDVDVNNPKEDSRSIYASWMTSPANPRFTRVIANRMWKLIMGLGLVEPADHFTDATTASNPELLQFLSRLMVSVHYDLRRYEEILCDTAAWQRQATRQEYNAGEAYYFQGPLLRRMTAEQIWDSLLTLVVPDLDGQKGPTAESLYAYYDNNKGKTQAEFLQLAIDMGKTRVRLKEINQEMQQLRTQMQGAPPADVQSLRLQMQMLNDERKTLEESVDPLRAAAKAAGPKVNKNAPKTVQGLGPLLRASELPAPAPAGHLLRVFGQSDRQLIDNGTANPAVTQALTLLNGFVDGSIVNPHSVLGATLSKSNDPAEQVIAVYLMVLGRQPTTAEKATIQRLVGSGATKDLANDVAWALLNNSEFLFVQ